MANLTALMFDLDGTLVDTADANYLAYSDALAEVGVLVERAHFDSVATGRNWRQFVPSLLGQAGNTADAAGIAARKRALYPGRAFALRFNTPLFALAKSCRPTMKTALVTTASADSVRTVLASRQSEDIFDTTVTGDDVQRHKPEPDAYLLAVARLGVEPAACLAFEDSDIGVASATAAGIAVVRVAF